MGVAGPSSCLDAGVGVVSRLGFPISTTGDSDGDKAPEEWQMVSRQCWWRSSCEPTLSLQAAVVALIQMHVTCGEGVSGGGLSMHDPALSAALHGRVCAGE